MNCPLCNNTKINSLENLIKLYKKFSKFKILPRGKV